LHSVKSTVILEIDAPQSFVAVLFADPGRYPNWMKEIERCEPVSGELGMPGSTFRLVPKKGATQFTVTVLRRDLPNEYQLRLDAFNVTVAVRGLLSALPDERTRLISQEEFRFSGLWRTAFGMLARGKMHAAHRRQMQAFKRFAEYQRPSQS
jgi:Polyketide cyclase / dehydrase and lipid transport